MFNSKYNSMLVVVIIVLKFASAIESRCSSYDYEEKILERLVRTEFKFDNAMTAIETAVENVEKELAFVKQQQAMIAHMSSDLIELRNQTIDDIKNMSKTPNVAFRASLSSNISVSSGTDLIFPDVRINYDNGYNVTTGHFTTPVTGTYVVTVQVCPMFRKHIGVNLVVDGSVQTEARYYESSTYICFTTTDVMRLQKGNQLWVECGSITSPSTTLYQDSNHQTYFAAVLVNM